MGLGQLGARVGREGGWRVTGGAGGVVAAGGGACRGGDGVRMDTSALLSILPLLLSLSTLPTSTPLLSLSTIIYKELLLKPVVCFSLNKNSDLFSLSYIRRA